MLHRLARWSLLSLSLAELVACNDLGGDPDGPAEVEFEPLCGQDGPVALMEVAADEEVQWVGRVRDSEEFHVRVSLDEERGLDDPPQVRRSAVIDECGDVIAEVASPVHSLQWWDDVLVGCTDDGLVWLTDYDDPSPSVLVRENCSVRQVGNRRVAMEAEWGEIGRIVTIDTEGSAVMVRELVDAASIIDLIVRPGADGEILIQTPELAVERVDPGTGARERVLEQAAEGQWSSPGAMISYQRPSAGPDDPSPLILRDRRTGVEQTVDPGFPVVSFGWYGEELLSVSGTQPERQLYLLDPLRALDVPAGTVFLMRRDDGSLWLERSDRELGTVELLLWREGEVPQSAWTCSSCRVAVYENSEAYQALLMQGIADPNWAEAWRLDRAGGPPRLIGNSLFAGTVLADGRVLSVRVGQGQDRDHGPLLLAHELGEDEVTLVPNVDASSIQFTLGFDTPGELVYEEEHDDGTATLQRVRLVQ